MKKIRLLLALGLMVLGAMMNSVSAQEIGAWKGFKSGAATFTFLQNAPCHVTYVAPLFDSYGYEASFYVVTGTVTNWSDWQGVADNGHEIGSYGMTNTTSINESELIQSKSIINSHITGQNCITLCYPNCQRPENTGWMSNYFIAGSDCRNRVIDGSNLWIEDPYLIPKIMTGEQGINSTTQITSKMQEAINSKGWAVFMTFGLQGKENGNAIYSPTSPDALRGALQWAEDNGNIWVSSLRNVVMYTRERFQSTFALQSETTTAATYSLTHSIADAVCNYDYPLSLRVPLQGWTDIEVKQNGNVIPHTVQDDYIYFDAVPNAGNIVVTHATAGPREIYAVKDGTKFVLYYDDQKASRENVIANWTPEQGANNMSSTERDVFTTVELDASMQAARPTSTSRWFYSLMNVTRITHLNYLNTSNVTNMSSMFDQCQTLAWLDVSGFDIAKVTNMYAMFSGCRLLNMIYCENDWSLSPKLNASNTNSMFYGCSQLHGDRGTAYDAAHVDFTYALPDRKDDKPGYFSRKGLEAYITIVGSKLTLYYDNRFTERDGASDYWAPDMGTYFVPSAEKAAVTEIEIDASVQNYQPTTTQSWFSSLSNATTITGLNYLNTSKVKNMSYMFSGCSSLTTLDISGFEANKVTNTGSMFQGCSALTTIYCNESWYGKSNITGSTEMFKGCTALVGGRGTAYSASNPTDKTYAEVDMLTGYPGYFTVKGGVLYAAMEGSKMVVYYDENYGTREALIANWYAGAGLNYGTEFMTNEERAAITAIEIDASVQNCPITSTNQWFSGLSNATTITGLNNLNTSKVKNMTAMFSRCSSLTSLDLSGFNTGNVTKMSAMFFNCSSLTTLNLSGFNTAKVVDMDQMFQGCAQLTSLDLRSFNVSSVLNLGGMFAACSALTTIECNSDWSGVTDLDYTGGMFYECTSLVGSNGTVYDPGHVNAAYARPDGGSSQPGYFTGELIEPEVYTVFNSSTGVLTYYYDDQKDSREGIVEVFVPGLNDRFGTYNTQVTKAVIDASMQGYNPTSLARMFVGSVSGVNHLLSNMTTIEGLENLNTSNVNNMDAMFYGCSALTSMHLSGFNTANVTTAATMFAFCSSLTTLDLSGFNVQSLYVASHMFYNCFSLAVIYCNDDWSVSGTYSEDMFTGCTSLVGGKGTAYDAAHTDKAYARPDKGTSQPGYFTLSPEKAVEDLIDAIGEVEYTAESKAKIDEARAGYDALTKAQKEKVSNYDVLKAAEALYLALKMEAEYAEAIAEVEGECEYTINLVTPGTFKIAMVVAMGDHTWVDVHHLCVSGPMNDDDLSYLAQCVNMVTLSLRNAQFETYGASKNWKSLEKILLPPTCKTLKKEAFYRCEKLEYINLGDVETFGEEAFYYCERLPEVDLHSAKTLNHRVFEYCSALTSVNMPEATYIGTQCFVGCSNLVSASMPKATTIGGSAFGYLTKLTHVELCDDIERFEGSAFYDCKALLSVKLPSKLRYIGSNTFTNIIEVEGEWPKGIEYIGSGNFKNLNYMVIGPNVTALLSASNKWQNIYCYAADPQAVVSKYNPFTASNVGNATLYVPRSSLYAYKLNQAYANFLHIYSPYTMLSTDRITEDAQLILHSEAALKTSAPSPLNVGSYEQYIHLGPKQYTSQTVTEEGVQVTHYYSYLHHTGILHANSPLSSDEVTVHLIPMHKQWNFITLPFDVSVQDISIWARGTGSKENGTPGVSQYVFREYSGANRASGSGATWVNVPEDGVLQANKGYILYWAVEGGTSQSNYYPGTLSDEFIYYFRMPAMHTENHSNIFATGDVQVPLTHYSSEFPQNVSWNLVGNPYPCMFDIRQTDFDATMTMWNGTAYVAYSPIDDPYTLRPGEAFFVQAPDEVDAITFYQEGRYDATKIEIDENAYGLHMMPARNRVTGGRTLYNFLLSDSAYSDRARLVVNPQASAEYDVHRDAAKMLSTDAGVPQLWIEADGVRYAINECPAQDSYHMGAFIAADGAYHISLVSEDTENTVWLTDLATNSVTNLSQGAYSFTSAAGMYAGRFLITFGANAPTSVENVQGDNVQGTKLLIDCQLIIITPQGRKYTASGVEL